MKQQSIVMQLGPFATTTQIVDKLDTTYGEVEQPVICLSEFYCVGQGSMVPLSLHQ